LIEALSTGDSFQDSFVGWDKGFFAADFVCASARAIRCSASRSQQYAAVKRDDGAMRKLLYFAVGLFLLAAFTAGSDGSSSSKTEVKKVAAKCLVDREKSSNMKEGMSIFQIERDIGCSGDSRV
jgi:hypothetical protein